MRMKNAVLISSFAASISTILLSKAPTVCKGSYYIPSMHPDLNASGLLSAAHMAFYGVSVLVAHVLIQRTRALKPAFIRINAR
jgi:hypothetical protein